MTVAAENARPDSEGIVHKMRNITFKSGMEDELAAAFTNAELKTMVERGDLSGDWKSTKK